MATPLRWSIVIPVKVLAQAKSRLAELAGPRRPQLALAMAADTVAAALACDAVRAVLVITDDAQAAAQLSDLGALVLPDKPGAGLNPALEFGAAQAAAWWPEDGTAALAADLPALGPAELAGALTAAAGLPAAFVADAAGTGTTLYLTGPGASFSPRFGTGSRAAHLRGGAVQLDLPADSGLRRDVDTAADLRQAVRLGLGPRTAALAAELDAG
ncbi:MAG TPA: 2-phospho-L-lactate guanylyltransferase [Streptosporangiaceae bacterium]|jgi:2-phospho-L-lactate guanylyltransferase